MRNIIMIALAMLTGLSAQAQEKKNKNANHNISVAGNCEQCKRRIEKAAFSVRGVKSAEWNADDQVLHIILNEEKASVDDIRQAIAKAGHDTDKVRAVDADYATLPACCRYQRAP